MNILTAELEKRIKAMNGRRKQRIITDREIKEMQKQIDNAKDTTTLIRVYSFNGFVPNAYKWRAEISYLEAAKNNNDEWQVTCRVCDAKRSYGSGALVTINGKAT